MHITCEDNTGFEDALTVGRTYQSKRAVYHSGSYQIVDDTGKEAWYGRSKFSIIGLEARHEY